jgi:hypothetical protein
MSPVPASINASENAHAPAAARREVPAGSAVAGIQQRGAQLGNLLRVGAAVARAGKLAVLAVALRVRA